MEKSVHTSEYGFLRSALREARTKAGLSQRELALRLQTPHSWVAKVESGERRLDLVEFFWFIKACGDDPMQISQSLFKQWQHAKSKKTPENRKG
jgi:transcriptional regulator with XRE-family HTH domain